MPLYEYECRDCDKQVEVLVRKPEDRPNCPECGSDKLTKLLSVIGAPVISDSSRPTAAPPNAGGCGRSQCASGCMFDN